MIGSRCDESGKVFYAPAETLSKGPLMLMGHNPGGIPNESREETIDYTLQHLDKKKGSDYLHEDWGCGPKGSKLQRSVRLLFHAINADLETTFTTNLIFFRSHSVASSSFREAAPYCWRLHRKFLAMVDPDILIVFGTSGWSPYAFIKEQTESVTDQQTYDSGHGTWKIRSFSGTLEGRHRQIFGFPHFSRYMTKPDSEGVFALRRQIAKLRRASRQTMPLSAP